MHPHRAERRGPPHHPGRIAQVKRIVDVAFSESHVDVRFSRLHLVLHFQHVRQVSARFR